MLGNLLMLGAISTANHTALRLRNHVNVTRKKE